MKRLLLLTLLALMALPAVAQENPAPLPPNYELIKKETGRWFGEYRYKSLVKRFERCDTTMTVDHYRCLYYGAALRGDSIYTLSAVSRRTGNTGWLQLMGLVQAVWSSGNGSDTLPFHVASYADARVMRDDTDDSAVCCSLMGKPMRRWTKEKENPMPSQSSRSLFGERDSIAMVRLGVLPTAEQRRLFKLASTREAFADDSLYRSYESVPHARLWLDLQFSMRDRWGTDQYERHLSNHRGDTSVLLAEYYLRMAKEALEDAEKYGAGYRYRDIIGWCDTIRMFWAGSVAARHALVLRGRVLTGDVRLKDDHRPYIVPYAADEWALGTVWHRMTKKVYLRLTTLDTLEREHPKVLKEWTMEVTEHPDLDYHEAYVYLPPMPTGRYLLWASADSLFRSYEAQEVVFSDRYLMADQVGRGVVMDSRTGKPVQGFQMYLQLKGETVASTRTDQHGCFAFDVPDDSPRDDYRLYAPYKGLNLARGMRAYPLDLENYVLNTNSVDDEWEEEEDEDDSPSEEELKEYFEKEHGLYIDSLTCDSIWFSYGCWDYTAGEMKYTPAVDAEFSVERLLPPAVHRLNHTMLSHDAEHSIDSAEFERRYPGFAYSRYVNHTDDWPVDEQVGIWHRHFESAKNHAFALPLLAPDGVYRATLSAGDKSSHTTVYQGRYPISGSHIDAWMENQGMVAVGDTLRIHIASWQKEVRAVVMLEVNGQLTDCREVILNGDERVLEYPLGEVEGIVMCSVASVWHGEPSNVVVGFAVGPRAKDYMKQFNVLYFYMERHFLEWTRYYDEQRLRQAPQAAYPDRQQFFPVVWRYLDLKMPEDINIHLYCPGEYNRWRLFSFSNRIRCR